MAEPGGGLLRADLREIFGEHVTELHEDLWQWRNSCDLYLSSNKRDETKIDSMMVSRPVQDPRLWDALAAILKLGKVVLYFPGGKSPLAAHRGVAQHMPLGMAEAWGSLECVTTGKQISDAIANA